MHSDSSHAILQSESSDTAASGGLGGSVSLYDCAGEEDELAAS